jgi:hypothetical protein
MAVSEAEGWKRDLSHSTGNGPISRARVSVGRAFAYALTGPFQRQTDNLYGCLAVTFLRQSAPLGV